jgi:hypothetical protein
LHPQAPRQPNLQVKTALGGPFGQRRKMAFSAEELVKIQDVVGWYIERIRPQDEKIRKELDLAFRVEGHNVYLFEIRPDMRGRIMTHDVAKTTYVRTENVWKIYWMRADLKWHAYEKTNVKSINDFVKTVEADKYGCFWG